jgi:ATP citrate (pro-S)-lyase
VVSLLLKSPARPKVLVIAGGVANFTDIRVTFSGVVRALNEAQTELVEQGVKIFVRRGGPHEAEGLAHIEVFLRSAGLLGRVAGPELILADIIPLALSSLAGDVS